MSKYIMTIDEGTTSARTLVTDHSGKVISVAQLEFTQHFPNSGWVEHDAVEIWNTQLTTISKAKQQANIKSTEIAAIGITNQRETIVVWDKDTGLPIYNAIVWQDTRQAPYCKELEDAGKTAIFTEKTGLIVSPYFSGTKLKWILDNVEGARDKAKAGRLMAGTIDSWLIFKLTNGAVHATDVSNASRTLLFNIHTQEWDKELCDILDIPMEMLPKVNPSSFNYGNVDSKVFSSSAQGVVPIAGVIGDQQSALFGQLATEVGDVKNTYGTGCFTLVNTGTKAVPSKNKLLTTIAWKINEEETVYALEGSVFIAGAAMQWLRDGIKIIDHAADSDTMASRAEDDSSHRVYVVPAFTGLAAPYWDSTARGAIFGLERGTERKHIVKATLESIAYQSNDLITAMGSDLGAPIKRLKVDGGAAASDYTMQFQASISQLDVIRPKNTETTAMGAAYMAGLAVGYWKSIDEIKKIAVVDKEFKPNMDDAEREKLLKGWKESIKRTQGWTESIW